MTYCSPDFGEHLTSHMPALRRYARRLTRNGSAADDLVQDCCLRALTRSHQFQPGTNLRGWLFTIMHSVHVNRCRRMSREVPLPDTEAVGLRFAVAAGQEQRVELGDFIRAFEALPAGKRDAVTLVAWHGLSYEEAASRMGVPTGTVRSRLSRVRDELHQVMEGSPVARSSGRAVARGHRAEALPLAA